MDIYDPFSLAEKPPVRRIWVKHLFAKQKLISLLV
jgi:hypothetical protein